MLIILLVIGLFIAFYITLYEIDDEQRELFFKKSLNFLKKFGEKSTIKTIKFLDKYNDFPPFAIILAFLLIFLLSIRTLFFLFLYLFKFYRYAIIKITAGR